MRLTKQVSDDGKTLTIRIQGRFDFSLHQEFRQAYESCPGAVRYVIDLGATEYIDSAACGMLMVLRDTAGGDQADISIVKCNPPIKKTLAMLQFHRLFKID